VRGNYACEMGRSARTCDNHANSAVGGFASVISGTVRGTMCRSHVDFVGDSKTIESLAAFLHYFEIRVTSHHY
jgi:hypothetical protein